jgi:TPR repeat protein
VKWYRLAADQGNDSAQFTLGLMYANGQGVPQDYAEAVRSFRKAADQGLAHAQFNLGARYVQGQGVPQDYVSAHMWLSLSAAQNNNDATKFRDMIAAKMNPAQIAEAQKLAREWKPTKQPTR